MLYRTEKYNKHEEKYLSITERKFNLLNFPYAYKCLCSIGLVNSICQIILRIHNYNQIYVYMWTIDYYQEKEGLGHWINM